MGDSFLVEFIGDFHEFSEDEGLTENYYILNMFLAVNSFLIQNGC